MLGPRLPDCCSMLDNRFFIGDTTRPADKASHSRRLQQIASYYASVWPIGLRPPDTAIEFGNLDPPLRRCPQPQEAKVRIRTMIPALTLTVLYAMQASTQ